MDQTGTFIMFLPATVWKWVWRNAWDSFVCKFYNLIPSLSGWSANMCFSLSSIFLLGDTTGWCHIGQLKPKKVF